MNCLKCVTGIYVADTSDRACDLANSLPSLSITSPNNIPHLTDLDADLNMPLDNNNSNMNYFIYILHITISVSIVLMIFIVIMTSTSVY